MASITEIISLVHPSNNATSVLVADKIWILFTHEMSESSFTSGNFFVEGPDTDTVIGPDVGIRLPNVSGSGSNDQFESAGFKGIVPGTFTFEKINLNNLNQFTGTDIDGTGNLWRTKVIFTPINGLAPSTEYTVHLLGDENETDDVKTGVRSRSVFDTVSGTNTGNGTIIFGGDYCGEHVSDEIAIEISTAGSAGTAWFRWWKNSNPSYVHGPVRTEFNRYIDLEDGIAVSFGVGNFAVNDTFSVIVRQSPVFTGNTYISFVTGSGSIETIPEYKSTTVDGSIPGIIAAPEQKVISFSPPNKSTNLPTEQVTGVDIKFNCNLSQVPVIHVVAEPVNGMQTECPAVGNITFTATIVNNNTLHIVFTPGQLRNNNLVNIIIDPPITGTDQYGNIYTGTEPIEYFLTTTYTPMYSSIRKVRLEIGSFISSIDDDTVNLAIFEASHDSEHLTWAQPNAQRLQFFEWARSQWVTCKAAEILIQNIIGIGGLRSKKLDNLEVVYEQKRAEDLLKKIDDCLARWEAELNSGGAAVQNPMGVVKGELDPEAPHVGRMWEKGPYSQRVAGSNIRYRGAGNRRYINSWRQRF